MKLFSRSYRICDGICNEKISVKDGFVLSTRQVTGSEEYWRRSFEVMAQLGPDNDGFVTISVTRTCNDPTRWVMCSQCVECFVLDLREASRLALTGKKPADAGAVPPEERAMIAARAWRHVTGHWPDTVTPVEEPTGACNFCEKPMYAGELEAKLPPEKARSFAIDGWLAIPSGPPGTSLAGDSEYLACMTCMARVSVREQLRSLNDA